jgi:1-deoxy-D-xylulose-5-phosphate synthase
MSGADRFPRLHAINAPADLRALPESELPALAEELRAFLIDTVSQMGGHFAAGLGTVELTLALHYVYDTPHDRVVWDVGHQAYPHKVLTGRRDRLHTIKLKGGLAPFPARAESEYDSFGVGHSSTSISAALGMAMASQRLAGAGGTARRVVAVLGDGAMSAGLAFEALNHAGSLDVDLLVVLNDNDMSISENVGALSNYFARVLSGRLYAGVREGGKRVLRSMPNAFELARRSEEHVKGMLLPGTMFEEMGFNYIGPIDGHDVHALVRTLANLRNRRGPQFLHIVTRKGKGYPPAEADPIRWHGPGPFDAVRGVILKEAATGPSYSQIFGQWLCDVADRDPRIVGITPAMREGSGLVEFERRFPERYFDVAIAEQHALTFAAGLACEGLRPVVAIYSTFLQRAYDQLVHDIALQALPVTLAIDRAGLVGGDGATHQGAFDLSLLRCVPNMVVMAPGDENECRQMLYTAVTLDGPAAVRYPRGPGPGVTPQAAMSALPVGKAEVRREGRSGLLILAFGAPLAACAAVADSHDATLVNMRFVKPLDEDLVLRLAQRHERLVTVEENVVAGGAGSAVLELLAARGVALPVLQLGLPDRYIEHGSRTDNLVQAGLDSTGIGRAIDRCWPRERLRSWPGAGGASR